MKKLTFVFSVLIATLLFTSCGSANEKAGSSGGQQAMTESVPLEPVEKVIETAPTTFVLTEAQPVNESIPRDGGDCFNGKGTYFTRTISSVITVTVGEKTYEAKLEGTSNWGTGAVVKNCGGFDPEQKEFLAAQKNYEALSDKNLRPEDLSVTIENGKLVGITVVGKPLQGNLKKPSVKVQLASLN